MLVETAVVSASRWLLVVVALVALDPAGAAERYLRVSSGGATKTLALTTAKGRISAPRTEEDQESFSQARLSPDQSTAGWLAEVSGCCQSYPLPLTLVLFRDGKVVFRFRESTAIWHWAFLNGGKEVAYQWTYPHGFVPTYYTRRSALTGAVLERFTCAIDERSRTYLVPKRIPEWVRAVVDSEPCPGAGT
ncbi:MAG: hypothetical protein DYH18_07115 [Xanthomonadales bacterium PRO7]|jgi:hypothetical protein|nr:hypothetical protein [Xanthomonadales bacterium PRO7]HMM57548.1 hypothetical protein [Rudaea sp.]